MKLLTKAIENDLRKHPFCSQDEKGEDAKVIVKFFGGAAATWLVTEGEIEDGDWTFFGCVTLDGSYWEWGYFTMKELKAARFRPFGLGVERDYYFKGTVKDGKAA